MLQGVGDVFELRDMSQANTNINGPKQFQGDAKFLFVGRGIDKEAVQAQLKACIQQRQQLVVGQEIKSEH